MSSETYSYKGISAGKYVEGSIEALSQEEASFKLKEQKIIITKLIRTKKKAVLLLVHVFPGGKSQEVGRGF